VTGRSWALSIIEVLLGEGVPFSVGDRFVTLPVLLGVRILGFFLWRFPGSL